MKLLLQDHICDIFISSIDTQKFIKKKLSNFRHMLMCSAKNFFFSSQDTPCLSLILELITYLWMSSGPTLAEKRADLEVLRVFRALSSQSSYEWFSASVVFGIKAHV